MNNSSKPIFTSPLVILIVLFLPSLVSGDIGFTKHTISTSADYTNNVLAVDMDNDGDVDILSGSIYTDTIAWYENDGSENFTAHTITTSADAVASVHAVDVDGDGDVDIRVKLEKKGLPIGPYDILIAASALACKATLVTHNIKEFKRVKGLKIEDWY